MSQACPKCQLSHQCVCELAPEMPEYDFDIALLMHPNEHLRDTNTGKLLGLSTPNIQRFTWDRKTPPAELIEILENPSAAPFILFPSEEALTPNIAVSTSLKDQDHKRPTFIILDATWQEAQKMLNKSRWLEGIPLVSFEVDADSSYQLRRNQQQGNLCTYEIAAHLIAQLGDTQTPPQMLSFFEHYVKVFKADKSGHRFTG